MLLAVVIVVGAVIGVFVFGIAESPKDPSPTVYRYTATSADTGGTDDQFIQFTHKGGESLDISEGIIEFLISVDGAACQKKTRLTNPTTTDIGVSDYEHDDILDASGLNGELGTGSDEKWKSGELAELRISDSKCSMQDGDSINVKVVHKPSTSIIIDSDVSVGG